MDSNPTFSEPRGFADRLSARRKLGLVALLILVGAFAIDPESGTNTGSDSATRDSEGEQDQFSEMDSLLASFEDDIAVTPAVEPYEQSETTTSSDVDSEPYLTLDNSPILTLPSGDSAEAEVSIHEVSHTNSDFAVNGADDHAAAADTTQTGERRSSIRLTGTIYPVHHQSP